MREIKFRGKDKSSKQWIYGYYVGEDTIIPTDEVNYDCGYIEYSKCYECDNIGQFTGLNDVNDTEIYEGDIVDFVVFDRLGGDTRYKGIVVFEYGNFLINIPEDSECYDNYDYFDLYMCVNGDDEFTVIGNIYDND